MSGAPGRHGRRLSAAEYDEQSVRIHDRALAAVRAASGGRSVSIEDLDRHVRRLELDLAIDRRIGVDFPRDQRERVLEVRERVEGERRELAMRLLRREIAREDFAAALKQMVDGVVKVLSSELTVDEVKDLLGIPDLGAAALPLDPKRIRSASES